MAYVTLQQAKDKVILDLDLDHESFIRDSELTGYFNDAVSEVNKLLMKLNGEDTYYLSNAKISTIAGTSEYALPTDIFGNKIVRVIYQSSNTDMYTVKRLRGRAMYELAQFANTSPSSKDPYKYILVNKSTSAGHKMTLFPTPQVSESNVLTVWYIREVEKATLGASLLDCPEEFIQFVYAFVKMECLKKDIGNPMLEIALQDYIRLRQDMVDTLTNQTHDGDNEIVQDFRYYDDSI